MIKEAEEGGGIVSSDGKDEEEEVCFCEPAKLYVFGVPLSSSGDGDGTRQKIWQNRGRGDCRILRNPSTLMLRLLMQQDRTGAIIVNHPIDPRIELELSETKPDRSWVWSLLDESSSKFGVRFDSVEVANDFQNVFIDSQNEMEALWSSPDDDDENAGTSNKFLDDIAEA